MKLDERKNNIMTIEELSEEYVKSTLIGSESIKKSAFKAGAYKVLEEIEDELNELLAILDTMQEEPVNDVWHDANEEPELDAKIVTLCEGQLVTTTRRKYVRGFGKFNPEKWTYLDDLLYKKEEPVSRTLANIEAAMQEVEEKSKAFTNAHQGENSDTILAQMRGEEPICSVWNDARKRIPENSTSEILCYRENELSIVTIGKIANGTVKWAYIDDLLYKQEEPVSV